MKPEVNISSGIVSGVLMLFLVFWLQSGWYRVDCALNVEKACALVAEEYAKKPRP